MGVYPVVVKHARKVVTLAVPVADDPDRPSGASGGRFGGWGTQSCCPCLSAILRGGPTDPLNPHGRSGQNPAQEEKRHHAIPPVGGSGKIRSPPATSQAPPVAVITAVALQFQKCKQAVREGSGAPALHPPRCTTGTNFQCHGKPRKTLDLSDSHVTPISEFIKNVKYFRGVIFS